MSHREMPATCPGCGASIAPDASDLARGHVQCAYCGTRFSTVGYGALAGAAAAAAGHTAQPLRPKVALPRGIKVQDGEEFVISRRWRSARAFVLIVFALLWNSFVVYWYQTDSVTSASNETILSWFGLVQLGIGVLLAYRAVSEVVNTTYIRIKDGKLSITHGPLPWPGRKAIDVATILQFYCKEKITRTKNGVHYSYSLCYIDANRHEHQLVLGLPKPEQILFLEQELEGKLGIIDRAVSGELRRW